MKITITKENEVLLAKYCKTLEGEFCFKVSLEQGLNRLLQITLGNTNGNTD